MASPAETQALNEAFLDALCTPGMEKTALDAVNEFTRTTVREDGIWRRIIPMVQVSNSDLTRLPNTDLPCIVVDKEPSSPAAVSLPFGPLPPRWYIKGSRYVVSFYRKATPMFQKDLDTLRTYKMDIRQVISDNSLKDLLAEEDRGFLAGVQAALIGVDQAVPYSGVNQWQTIFGGITRDTFQAGLSIMATTPSHLEPNVILMNNVTIREFNKWGRDETGGDKAERLLFDGWSESQLDGKQLVVTIKRNLVPDYRMHFFGDPRFVGKAFTLEDTVLHVERKLWMVEWCSYETIGGAIGHTGGLAISDFA